MPRKHFLPLDIFEISLFHNSSENRNKKQVKKLFQAKNEDNCFIKFAVGFKCFLSREEISRGWGTLVVLFDWVGNLKSLRNQQQVACYSRATSQRNITRSSRSFPTLPDSSIVAWNATVNQSDNFHESFILLSTERANWSFGSMRKLPSIQRSPESSST